MTKPATGLRCAPPVCALRALSRRGPDACCLIEGGLGATHPPGAVAVAAEAVLHVASVWKTEMGRLGAPA
jgi:hypothetical protein